MKELIKFFIIYAFFSVGILLMFIDVSELNLFFTLLVMLIRVFIFIGLFKSWLKSIEKR